MVVLKVISAVEKEKRRQERGEASTQSGMVARQGLIKKMQWPGQQRQEL